ncbi:barstar family protein [Pseudoduganella violacea]|uniref:Ribonuclease inhibitor n=1 Tax=Pseudoduganella violacea TaxID=1715466 RepID=A0A7W5B5M2_9BURK|nr:barstar family protein [Pseudoduganella violacea]MBB3117027.1 ribonuclease inhibitor [Pseudoduganella violacea]
MKTYLLDCSKISSEGDFWRLYLETIRPDGAQVFGRNLSAFWDAVSGGGPGWPGECRIRVCNTGNLQKQTAQFFNGLQRIAREVRDDSGVSIVFD